MNRLLGLLVTLLLFLAPGEAQAQNLTTIVLVRHAERGTDDPRDPGLSESGRARAVRLQQLLADLPVQLAWTTDYRRTRQTLEPLATSQSLTLAIYDPRDLGAAVERIVRESVGKTVLVAGHSNTVPAMVNLLAGKSLYADLAESDYGKLWIVHLREGHPPIIVTLNY